MTLAEFLLARYDEDEAAARAAVQGKGDAGPWVVGADTAPHLNPTTVFRPSEWGGHITHACETELAADSLSVARHIACHDPARVLADCEAKRRIVRLAQADEAAATDPTDDPIRRSFNHGAAHHGHNVLLLLALPYADHKDWREEWRP